MQKLITLNGPAGDFHGVTQKSDLAAGLAFWKIVADEFPGITWRDVAEGRLNGEFLAGKSWLRRLSRGVGNTLNKVGNGAKNVLNFVGEKGGEIVRLVTDEKVASTVMKAGKSYSTGGSSSALSFLKNKFGSTKNPIVEGGARFKAGVNDDVQTASFPSVGMIGGIDGKVVMIGIAGLLALVLITNVGKK